MSIPAFRDDGCLPPGVHLATLDEVRARFGESNERRRELMQRVVDWGDLAHAVQARRLLLAGSFVTEKGSPNDVDAVMLLPLDFTDRVSRFDSVASEIRECVDYRQPQELFPAFKDSDWDRWGEYFSRVPNQKGLRKGMVEVQL